MRNPLGKTLLFVNKYLILILFCKTKVFKSIKIGFLARF